MSAELTAVLTQVTRGDQRAADLLLESVYAELRGMAGALLKQEPSGHTLQPTALVHEAYLKLVDQSRADWKNRAHFIAVAAQAMRRILIDHARTRKRAKRGSGGNRLTLHSGLLGTDEPLVDVLDLDEALNKLEQINAQSARVVDLRYFGGLTIEETAAVLDASTSTVEREWRYARAWLFRTLGGSRRAGTAEEPPGAK